MSSASPPVHVPMLSIPGLRQEDLSRMPAIESLAADGSCVPLDPGFPAVTCPVQATLTTGALPTRSTSIASPGTTRWSCTSTVRSCRPSRSRSTSRS